ncbi:hypothetical protein CEY16_07395 [Halalkalibacillus sediminis]|uniref:ATP synthase subunit I n=1 Tax=Halalkalibacillus sediminis TaxID=2018042 RepID=A0A2I0QTW4_9BACI|nr:ATP synthase subunit I [Halalkalibacillus sediminis]PKR77748.1 hypothetical protein CEY16_07395 [Halalkalibacillus sediminis]
MQQYTYMVNRQRKWMLYILAIYVVGWGFTDYQVVFASLILGGTFSLFSLIILHRKVDSIGQVAANHEEKKQTLGMVVRLANAALATVITLRFPEYFDIIAVVIGLMTSYVVIIIDYIFHQLEFNARKRGE